MAAGAAARRKTSWFFFDDPRDLKGQIVQVKINHTGVWSMSGTVVGGAVAETAVIPDLIPLTVI